MTPDHHRSGRVPPGTVIFALALLLLMLGHAVWSALSERETLAGAPAPEFIRWFWWIFLIWGLLIPVGLGIAVLAQLSWSRVLFAVYFVVEWLILAAGALAAGETATLVDFEFLAGIGAQATIILLLFAGPSSKWFKGRRLGIG